MSHCFIKRVILSADVRDEMTGAWRGQSQHNEPTPRSPPSSPPWMWLTAWSGERQWKKPQLQHVGGALRRGRRKTVHPRFPTPSGWRSTSHKSSFPCFWATHLGWDAEVYSWAAGEGQPDGTRKKAELEPETGRVQGDPAESDPSYMWFLQLLKAKSRTPLNISTIC